MNYLTRTTLICFVILILQTSWTLAQKASDYAVMIKADVSKTPQQITFQIANDTAASEYRIYRKLKGEQSWGIQVASLSATPSLTYIDRSVPVGSGCEYKFDKYIAGTFAATYKASGYCFAGIEYPATDYRGTVLLIVDSNFVSTLSTEILRLKTDLNGDGWMVKQVEVNRDNSVVNVKKKITDQCAADTSIRSLFLLGHVPVPYSGDIYPDGHIDHRGAWPADCFYGDIDGSWTDFSVTDTAASRTANRNKPLDGKYDQSYIPSNIDLQVGRVDLFDMPAFSLNETELTRRYLNKNHAFRTGEKIYSRRGLIDDNFGAFSGEAFAASGWRNFSVMVGIDSINAVDYFSTLKTKNYLWSYGCGGGSFTSISGVGNTTNFAADTVNSVFTMLFGSYFGDWNVTNNVLRAPLASANSTLVSFWAGRPHWFLHYMALGETVGYCTMLTQNNSALYQTANYGARFVHIALMGDPTLRMHVVLPPSNLNLTRQSNNKIKLDWQPSTDSIVGYSIYRATNQNAQFTKLNDTPIRATSFVDNLNSTDNCVYMVRALKLETTPSGTYFNLSQGIIASTLGSSSSKPITDNDAISVYPNPTNGLVNVEFRHNENCSGTVEIADITGKLIAYKQFNNEKNVTLNISQFPKGIYFIKTEISSFRSIKKIILR